MFDLTNLMQFVGHHIGPQPLESYKRTNYVMAGNGLFQIVLTPIAVFKNHLAQHSIPGLPPMDSVPELTIPKIPIKYWQMVLTFYRDVYEKDGTEASVLFFWNHNHVQLPEKPGLLVDGQLVIYCPKQQNQTTLSEFGDDEFVKELRTICTPLLESHSHHIMDAYFSKTDDANENLTQFYGVFGKINDQKPKFVLRYVCGTERKQIDPRVLFDFPTITKKTRIETIIGDKEPVIEEKTEILRYEGPWDRVEYPADWMMQHTKKEVSVLTKKPKSNKSTANVQSHIWDDFSWFDAEGASYWHNGNQDLLFTDNKDIKQCLEALSNMKGKDLEFALEDLLEGLSMMGLEDYILSYYRK